MAAFETRGGVVDTALGCGPVLDSIKTRHSFQMLLLMQMLRQIRGWGDSAIVYDPAMEYTRRFLPPKARHHSQPARQAMPVLGTSRRSCGQARKQTQLQYRCSKPRKTGASSSSRFRSRSSRICCTTDRPREELVEWMSNPKEIDDRVAPTEVANFIDHAAPLKELADWPLSVRSQRAFGSCRARVLATENGPQRSGPNHARDGSSSPRFQRARSPSSALTKQVLLRHQHQCSENSDLDCGLDLFAGGERVGSS